MSEKGFIKIFAFYKTKRGRYTAAEITGEEFVPLKRIWYAEPWNGPYDAVVVRRGQAASVPLERYLLVRTRTLDRGGVSACDYLAYPEDVIGSRICGRCVHCKLVYNPKEENKLQRLKCCGPGCLQSGSNVRFTDEPCWAYRKQRMGGTAYDGLRIYIPKEEEAADPAAK